MGHTLLPGPPWLMASLNTGERLEIYLQKNGDNILQSEHYSQYTGDSGIAADQGNKIDNTFKITV